MSNPADTPNGQPSAGGQELHIPKHRFDEVSARLRQAEEALQMKDRLYTETIQSLRQQQAPIQMEEEMSPEESGLDPSTHQAALKIAKKIAKREVESVAQQVRGFIGHLANDVEAAKFLAKNGPDKDQYLDRIREYQRKQQAETGTYMPMETAYKLVMFDEMQAKGGSRRRTDSAQADNYSAAQASADEPQHGVPNAANTRIQHGQGAAPTAGKSFSELSIDEMESSLDEEFVAGRII